MTNGQEARVRVTFTDGKIGEPAQAETENERVAMNEHSERWQELQEKINATIEEWRREHPEATLTEIEEAVDKQLGEMRARMVEDLAQGGRTADLRRLPKAERPCCPRCGQPVVANGKGRRKLKTFYEQTIELERHQAYCQQCELTFFPPR